MDQTDVMVIAAAALVGATVLILGFLRSSRTPEDGVRRLRLFVNTIVLGVHYLSIGLALALLALGFLHHNSNYWFAAFAVFGLGFLLFRDLSAPRADPFEPFFTNRYGRRVRNIERETSSLLDELAGGEASGDRAASNEPPPDEPPPPGSGDRRTWTRTFNFQFRWPPKRG